MAEASDEDGEEAVISSWAAVATLVIVTVGIAVCSEYLVDSIDEVVKSSGLSKTFIGLILLPIVGNAGKPSQCAHFRLPVKLMVSDG